MNNLEVLLYSLINGRACKIKYIDLLTLP